VICEKHASNCNIRIQYNLLRVLIVLSWDKYIFVLQFKFYQIIWEFVIVVACLVGIHNKILPQSSSIVCYLNVSLLVPLEGLLIAVMSYGIRDYPSERMCLYVIVCMLCTLSRQRCQCPPILYKTCILFTGFLIFIMFYFSTVRQQTVFDCCITKWLKWSEISNSVSL
jgi:hypothetical protein